MRAKRPGDTTLTLEIFDVLTVGGTPTPVQIIAYTDRFKVRVDPISYTTYEIARIDPI